MAITITRPTIPTPLPLTRGGTEATTASGARTKLELGDVALLTAPGGTSTFLRADKTWAVPPGGGGGGGDVSSSVGLSVDSELAIFDGTSGKLLKRGTGSGLALLTNGVLSIKAAPTGAVVGTTDTQTLTGKTISGVSNTLTIREADLAFTDLTTANVTTSAHGLVPKAPGGTTQFLRGDATWAAPAGGGGAPTDAEYITSTVHASLSAERVLTDTATITWDRTTAGQIKANATGGSYTDEQAQDAVGTILTDSATVDFTYDDATPSITGIVKDASLTEAKLLLADVETLNASTTAHGMLRKLSGTATEYLNGTGAWTTPSGGGTSYWSRVPSMPQAGDGLLAHWRMEEASGNRVDSAGGLILTPQGTTANLSNPAGITGQALGSTGSAYLQLSDHPTISMGAASFTVACWVYFTTLVGDIGLVGKGAGSDQSMEYLLIRMAGTNTFSFFIGNGTTNVRLNYTGLTPATATWYLVIGWYDAALDMQYLQVNNGTVLQVANAAGSHDNTSPLEVGRYPGFSGNYLNGRLDNLMLWKRVLGDTERAQLWNGGSGLDAPLPVSSPTYLQPATATDHLLVGTARTSSERLEVGGAVKVGTTTGTTDGTIRYTGTDFEGRTAGAWVSLTGPPLPLAIAQGGTGATDAAGARTALGLGTMATQNANAVAITGGTATLADLDVDGNTLRVDAVNHWVGLGVGAPTQPLDVTGPVRIVSKLHLGTTPYGYATKLELLYDKTTQWGASFLPGGDSGSFGPATFLNGSGAQVGSITTTASATAYNTSSDARLKNAVQPITDALARVRALRPVQFRWNSTDEQDEGFLAHELQQVAPRAVTGQPEELNDDGSIRPQQVDASKLTALLTAGLQAALAQIDALTARIGTLEEALGL